MDLNYLTVDTYSSASYNQLDNQQKSALRGALVNNVYQWQPEPVQPWMTDAACVGHDPDLFEFDRVDQKKLQKALKICSGCPVRASCLDHSSEADRQVTVRGGQAPTVFRAELCAKGHSNWKSRASSSGGGTRVCATCKNERERASRRGKMSA